MLLILTRNLGQINLTINRVALKVAKSNCEDYCMELLIGWICSWWWGWIKIFHFCQARVPSMYKLKGK